MGRTLPITILVGIALIIVLGLLLLFFFPMLFGGILLFFFALAIGGALVIWNGEFLLPAGTIIAGFFLVFLTNGGPFWHDSGEIGSAIWTLGVAHPTGFPLLMLGGKAMALLPLGNAFYRINLFDTLCLAGVLTVISLFFRQFWNNNAHGSFLGLAGFVLSATVLMHALNTEVYIPSVLGVAVGLLLLSAGYVKNDARFLMVAGFVLGLGMGGHVSWPLNLGGAALFIGIASIIKNRDLRILLSITPAFLLGMLIVLYLPVAASRGPASNWGDPSSWAAMLAHITGSSIRHGFNKEIGGFSLARFLLHLRMFTTEVWSDMAWILPLSALGMVVSLRKRPVISMALLTALILDLVFSVQVNPMGIIDRQTGVTTELILAIFAGNAGVWLYYFFRSKRVPAVVTYIFLALFPLMQAIHMPLSPRFNRVQGPATIVSMALDRPGNDCTLLTSSDDLSGLLFAGRLIEERRPDCLHLVKQHLLLPWHWRFQCLRAGRDCAWQERVTRHAYRVINHRLQQVINTSPGPVYFELGQPQLDRPYIADLNPDYPMYRLDKTHKNRWRGAVAAAVLVAKQSLDTGRACVAGYLSSLSVVLNGQGHPKQALEVSKIAVRIDLNNRLALTNRAVFAWWYEHRKDLAISLLKRAVDHCPDDIKALKLLIKYAGQMHRQKDLNQARRLYMAATGSSIHD